MARKLARRLYEDDKPRAPDSAGVPDTVMAHSDPVQEQEKPTSHDLGMRRDLDAVMAQIAALSGLVHTVLAQQVQQQGAAGTQLSTAENGDTAAGSEH